MNKDLNIAEILESCPEGTKLYSPMYGDVFLKNVRLHELTKNQRKLIVCTLGDEASYPPDFTIIFKESGKLVNNGECMLFPSATQRDWSKFKKPLQVDQVEPCKCYWYKITGNKEKDAALLDKLKDLLPDTMYMYVPATKEFTKGRIVYNNINHIEVINDVDKTFSQILKMTCTELKIKE